MHSSIKALLCLLAALPSVHAVTLILGDTSGNPRGSNALDIQSTRLNSTEVASGSMSIAIGWWNNSSAVNSTAIGVNNYAQGDEAIAIGDYNMATQYASVALGYSNLALEADSTAVGSYNEVHGLGHAFGLHNLVLSQGLSQNWLEYHPSGAFGAENLINSLGTDSFVFGKGNTLSAANTTVFGSGITNSTAGSTMIGPSDAAKVTILSSGNVGIGLGNTSPSEKLEVGGNAKINGTLTTNGALNTSGAINVASGQSITFANGGNAVSISSPGSSRLQFSAEGNAFEARSGGIMLPVGKKLMDQNSAALLSFGYTASAVNNIQIDNAATGQSPAIRAVGSDTNVGLQIIPKGTGSLTVPSGKVGLGVTSPASPLDVQAIMDNSAPAGLIVRRNSSQFIHLHEFGGGNHALEAVDPAANQKPFYISKMTTGGAPAAGQSDIVFSFVQDNGTGYINRSAFSALTLQAGTGNVGINTPTPGAKLTVVGSGSPVSSTATPNGILILSGATNTNTVLTAGVDNPGGNPYGWLQTRHANSGPAFYPLSLNPLGGNVGIGIIAPSERLDVTGNIKTSGQLILPGSGTDIFSVSNTSSGIHTEIKLSVGDNALDAEADKLTIGATDWATGTWHPRLSVMSSGNVGIGIASPSEKLDVVGNAKVSGTLTVGGAPVLTTAGGSGANLTALNASNISTGSLTAARLPSEAVQLTSTQTLTNKTLPNAKLTGTTTLGGSTVAQQVFVDSSGNVGIGTNTPGNKLTVIGDAFVQGNFVASSISSDTIISAYEVAANWITFGGGMFIESIPNPADPELWVSGGNLLHLNGYEKINLISKEIRIGLDTSFAPVIKAEVTPGSAPQTYDNQDLVLQPSGSGRVKITSSTEIVGNVTIKNMGAVKSVIRISPAGDIGMGDFTAGTNPNPEL